MHQFLHINILYAIIFQIFLITIKQFSLISTRIVQRIVPNFYRKSRISYADNYADKQIFVLK